MRWERQTAVSKALTLGALLPLSVLLGLPNSSHLKATDTPDRTVAKDEPQLRAQILEKWDRLLKVYSWPRG